MNATNEVFPSAPLALVAAEVRYPPVSEVPLGMSIQKRLRDLIGSDWVIHNETSQTLEAVIGPGVPQQAAVRSGSIGRIVTRQRTKIITIQPDHLVIEVTDYSDFADFQNLLERTAQAVESVLQPDGISRMGLRYIDEITVPESPPQWDRWLHSSLLAPAVGDLVGSDWTGAVQYTIGTDQIMVFRYGTSNVPVVAPSGPLVRPRVPVGPIFMLDFDGSWQPHDIPQFSAPHIAEMAGRLRVPLRSLFDNLVTPDLIETFRRAS